MRTVAIELRVEDRIATPNFKTSERARDQRPPGGEFCCTVGVFLEKKATCLSQYS